MNPKISLPDVALALNVTVQAVHKKIKTRKLKFYRKTNRIYFCHDTIKPVTNFKFEPKVLAFQIIKGGVGKTSLCLWVGVRASLYGARTLIIDLDKQGNLTKACNIKPINLPVMIDVLTNELDINKAIVNVSPGLDLLPSRIENALLDNHLTIKRLPLDRVYKDFVTSLKDKYDLILIDCPPDLGSSVTAITLASDCLIAPVLPSEFSTDGLDLTRAELYQINKNFKTSVTLHPIINQYDTRTHLSNKTLSDLLINPYYKDFLLRSVIRRSQEFENAVANKISIFDGLTGTTAKEDIDTLTKELLRIEGKPWQP